LSFRYAVLSVAALALGQPAVAGDSPFGYVYTTDTHPRGQREFEQWITRRHGHSRGDFDAWQFRTELEYGVTDNLQTALYLNYDSVDAFRNRPDITDAGPERLRVSFDPTRCEESRRDLLP